MNANSEFLPEQLPDDPLYIAVKWLYQANEECMQPNPDAMVIATADDQGNPSARVVLCKSFVADPGYLIFYTNYVSRKGLELARRPRAAAVFHWDSMHRQVCIEGPVVKSPPHESDAYFATRPWQRRIGAWASRQSQPAESRLALLDAVTEAAARFGSLGLTEVSTDETGGEPQVPRPPQWGGYRLWAESVELWVQGDHRIHDRARWTRSLRPIDDYSFSGGVWTATRLQP